MQYGISPCGRVHTVPGRLRVKLTAIKRAPELAGPVEHALRQESGVIEVATNPVTGSVLVHYDPTRTNPRTLLARLEPFGLSDSRSPAANSLSEFSNQLGKAVGKELVKLVLAQMLPLGPVEVLCALI